MKRTGFAKILAMCIMLVTVLGVLPLVMADDEYTNDSVEIEITEPDYALASGAVFIPGDPVEFKIRCTDSTPDTLEDVFDIVIFKDGETDPTKHKWFADDQSVDANGEAVLTVDGDDTLYWSDGLYRIYVGDELWFEDNSIGSGRAEWNSDTLIIRLYDVIADTDRTGYLPGDTVTVFYSVLSIKDGSLITEDAYPDSSFSGTWAVESEDDRTEEGPESFDEASGSFEFIIDTDGDPNPSWYTIGIWFNGSYGADREGAEMLWSSGDFAVQMLGVSVWTDRGTYQLGSVVKVSINTYVIGGHPEPDVKATIKVLKGTAPDAPEVDAYGGTDFYSDAAGDIFYGFSLDSSDFDEDETYTVKVNVTKLGKKSGQKVTFDVEAGGRAISVKMVFNKAVYTSGDTVDVTVETAVPLDASEDLTFLYSVSDTTGGTKALEVRDNFPRFEYDIPINFEGRLIFAVFVSNADGDSGGDFEMKDVHYAVLLLNAEPHQYEAGDTITADFELLSTLITDPSIFYRVESSSGIVLEGELATGAMTGTFQYTVPDVPADEYTFFVYANQDGIWVEAEDTCELRAGYDVEIWVDNPTYTPGDRVVIHYKITPRTDEGLPDKFVLGYGMSNGPQLTWQSDSSSGDIFYKIPGGINEGDVLFEVWAEDGDGNGLGGASEVLHIQDGASPLEWTRALDVPLFSWILLLLIILVFIFMLFRRPKAAAPEKAPAEAAPEPAPVEEEMAPMAPDEASPLAINCKSCGAEIEITTSKRPIEVMCPSCGETEMVE